MSKLRKSLKNFPLHVSGLSKHLSALRTKTLKSLKNWESAQKQHDRSVEKEVSLQKAAANALKEYSNAKIKNDYEKLNEAERTRVGTARNMSGQYMPSNNINYSKLGNSLRNARVSKYFRNRNTMQENTNNANKALSGIGADEEFNEMYRNVMGGSRSKRRTRRK